MTGFLVRSMATHWAKGSVLAVDAGTHLAAVTNIIAQHLPHATSRGSSLPRNCLIQSIFTPDAEGDATAVDNTKGNGAATSATQIDGVKPQLVLSTGPLMDFELPHVTAKANAAYFVRNLITTYLITHPHLDHVSGFVINTAGFQHTSRPKRLAGLPSTIDAFKTHIFNDTIWPNLSDEDGGVGLVSYMRLVEGGNLAIGEGEGRGYIEVCDGLAVKSWSVSHGKCMHNHSRRASGSGHTVEQFNDAFSRRASQSTMTPTGLQHSRDHAYSIGGPCVTDSSAFFLRDDHTGHEILIFGDVEPDSLSISPRTEQVWSDAAPKVVAKILKGILIECSYDESQSDDTLFGHLAPRHVIAELQVLANKVNAHRTGQIDPSPLKRKRMSNGMSTHEEITGHIPKGRPTQKPRRKSRKSNTSPESVPSEDSGGLVTADESLEIANPDSIHEITPNSPHKGISENKPLDALQVIIIHVKDNLKDGPDAGETILAQLEDMERQQGLGCSFTVSQSGTSYFL